MDAAKFVEKQLELLEKEKQTEVDEVLNCIFAVAWAYSFVWQVAQYQRAFSPKELQKNGVALTNMRITGNHQRSIKSF